ncbi:hypothetical protein SAV31267_034280 [Streptomyces avermitilis]|uniref:Response regulatory domain-containing protein n=1 Tax=Streptomyces avermitilis TaxID=33903 RepID=A0A4D4MP89_STRAX|nr:hypothetical protein SAV31267_034280 [Streptomyces avermitilis]
MGLRVLLIEDDETIAEPLAEGLGHFGLTVDHVATGTEGLRGPYGDVVLLDLGLPDMDGIDVCRGIRQVSGVPIVILSARARRPTGCWAWSSAPTTTWRNLSACGSWWPGCGR